MITGMTEEEQPEAATLVVDRPILVWVTDGVTEGVDKLEDVVWKKENVALGMKAFRTIQMRSEDAAKDPLFAGKGTEVPRVLVVDGEKNVTVLEKGKLTTSGVWGAMRKVASSFYTQDIEAVVKAHLKVLIEIDKASAEEKLLGEKAARLDAEKDKAEIDRVQKETDQVRARLENLASQVADLWKLTPKSNKSAA